VEFLSTGTIPATLNPEWETWEQGGPAPQNVNKLYDALVQGEHRGKKNTWVPNNQGSTGWGPVQLLVGPARDMLNSGTDTGQGIMPLTSDERGYLEKYVSSRDKGKTPPDTAKDRKLYESVTKKYIDFVWSVAQGDPKNFATLWRWGLYDNKGTPDTADDELWKDGINRNKSIDTDDVKYWDFFNRRFGLPDLDLGFITTLGMKGKPRMEQQQGLLPQQAGEVSEEEQKIANSALQKGVLMMLKGMKGPKPPATDAALSAAVEVSARTGMDPNVLMEGYNDFFGQLHATRQFTNPDAARDYPDYTQYQQVSAPWKTRGNVSDREVELFARGLPSEYTNRIGPERTDRDLMNDAIRAQETLGHPLFQSWNRGVDPAREEADQFLADFQNSIAPLLKSIRGSATDREMGLLRSFNESSEAMGYAEPEIGSEGRRHLFNFKESARDMGYPLEDTLLSRLETGGAISDKELEYFTESINDQKRKDEKQHGTVLNINVGPQ